jgi:hypothetical protein
MVRCKLCNSAEANQTGSHLMSAFMVTTMIGKREQEVGHLLSKSSIHGYRENVGAEPIKTGLHTLPGMTKTHEPCLSFA